MFVWFILILIDFIIKFNLPTSKAVINSFYFIGISMPIDVPEIFWSILIIDVIVIIFIISHLAYVCAVLGNILLEIILSLLGYCFWLIISLAFLVLCIIWLIASVFIRTLGSLVIEATCRLFSYLYAETSNFMLMNGRYFHFLLLLPCLLSIFCLLFTIFYFKFIMSSRKPICGPQSMPMDAIFDDAARTYAKTFRVPINLVAPARPSELLNIMADVTDEQLFDILVAKYQQEGQHSGYALHARCDIKVIRVGRPIHLQPVRRGPPVQ